MTAHSLPESVIEAFHLMWGNFPEPASLVHKSREVMAVNKAHDKLGMLKVGMNCAKMGDPAKHKGCLANKALADQESKYVWKKMPDKEFVAFWLPLDGYPEYFVHFGVGTFINYKEQTGAASE